jgi:hypothetical protein
MSTVPTESEVPDDVPTPDYVEQHTIADPDVEEPAEPTPDLSGDDLAAAGGTGRVETDQLGTDVEADEADLLEQATSVPPADEQLDEEE